MALSLDYFLKCKTRFDSYYNLQEMRDNLKTFTAPILSQKQAAKERQLQNIAVSSKKLFPALPKI